MRNLLAADSSNQVSGVNITTYLQEVEKWYPVISDSSSELETEGYKVLQQSWDLIRGILSVLETLSFSISNIMAQNSSAETPEYIVNIRWLFEGIMLPAVGSVGISGKFGQCFLKKYRKYSQQIICSLKNGIVSFSWY